MVLQAIFMIPTKPPPGLREAEEWSTEMRSLVADCLVKDPAQRPSADQLLQHPFVLNAPPSETLVPVIQEAQVRSSWERQLVVAWT